MEKIKFSDEVRISKERDSLGNIWITVFGGRKSLHKQGNLIKDENLSKMYSPQKVRDAEAYYIILRRAEKASGF